MSTNMRMFSTSLVSRETTSPEEGIIHPSPTSSASNARTHAAAIAQIDPDQLFYLHSRGLGDADARKLIVEGFLSALVERFSNDNVREAIAGALERRVELLLG